MAAAILVVLALVAPEQILRDAVMVLIYAIAALGLNVLIGSAGVVSLGAPAFFGVGAFSVAYLTSVHGWPFLAATVAGVLLSALVSLPVAPIAGRLKGIYLAIASVGLVFLGLHVFRTAASLTGGVGGRSVPVATVFSFELDTAVRYYLFVAAVLMLVAILVRNLLDSRSGRALRMLETSPVAARSLGISPLRFRAWAFVISSGLAGLSGGLLATWQLYVAWDQFSLTILGYLIAIIVIGGPGSVYGTVLGAAIVVGMPELLEHVTGPLPFIAESTAAAGITPRSFANILTGVGIIAVVVLEPGGLPKAGRRLWAAAITSRARDDARTGA